VTHPQVRPDPAFGLLKLYDDARYLDGLPVPEVARQLDRRPGPPGCARATSRTSLWRRGTRTGATFRLWQPVG